MFDNIVALFTSHVSEGRVYSTLFITPLVTMRLSFVSTNEYAPGLILKLNDMDIRKVSIASETMEGTSRERMFNLITTFFIGILIYNTIV